MPPDGRTDLAARMREGARLTATPDERIEYLRWVSGLATFSGLSLLLMLPLAFVGKGIAGHHGDIPGVAVSLGGCFFCATGIFYCAWKITIALLARRSARRHGTDSERYLRLARRAASRNSSLLVQAIVGLVTVLIVVATW